MTHAVDEASPSAHRLFLLRGGRIAAEGAPLDVLADRTGRTGWGSIRNVFEAVVERHDPEGPRRPSGSWTGRTSWSARVRPGRSGTGSCSRSGPTTWSWPSARSGPSAPGTLIEGTVERVVRHGSEAEVVVRTGGVAWVVGVVASAVEALGLIAGRKSA